MQRGMVLSLFRSASPGGYATVQLGDGTVTRAVWLSEWPPCPRSIVWLDQPVPGTFLIVGMEAQRRIIFHDDFMVVPGGVNGDTYWWGVGGSGTVSESPNSSRVGAIDIITGAGVPASYWGISKGNNMTAVPTWPAVNWLSAKWSVDLSFLGGASSVAHHVGFANNASSSGFGSGAGASAATIYAANNAGVLNWQVRTMKDAAGAVDLNTGLPVTLGWHETDLLVCDAFVAAWIDGVGPFVNNGNLPTADTATYSPQPVAVVYPTTAAAVGFTVDWMHLERVYAVRAPAPTS